MKKIILSLFLMILISVIGLGWGFDNLFSQYQKKSSTENSKLEPYRQLGVSLSQTLDKSAEVESFIDNWQQTKDVIVSLQLVENFPLPNSLKKGFLLGEPLTLEFDDSISMHFVLPTKRKVLTFTLPQKLNEIRNTNVQLALTIIFYCGVLTLLFIWLYPLLKHLHQLRTTAKLFGEGRLNRRIKISKFSYISDIELEFNRMANRIESLVNDNKLLSNAVSHDLRTPLARLRFGIEALQETTNPKVIKKYQQHISKDVDEMEKLVAVLLSYARLEQSMVSVNQHTVDLALLVGNCIGSTEQVIEKQVNWKPTTELNIHGDINYLSMLINNLLNNALCYASKHVNVEIKQERTQVILIVEDDGPGIVKDKREEVLKPFTRDDHVINKSGYGMGLAIVSRVALWHKANLKIEDSKALGGAKFIVTFASA